MKPLSLFDDQRLTLAKSIELTAESLNKYGELYEHWAIAFSGGKDSTATLTIVLHLIADGRVPKPKSITVLYADTRQELPPLHAAAMEMLKWARSLGCETKIVLPEMDKRFWVYILGRGVPSPNNGTMRWCTAKIKVNPMTHALASMRKQISSEWRSLKADLIWKIRNEWRQSGRRWTGKKIKKFRKEVELQTKLLPGPPQILMLTGVRKGESAVRDQRISVSCSKDGGECGQGWFQTMTAPQIDTLAPILHWRLCHVWDWLRFEAPMYGFPTDAVAVAYGQNAAEGEEPIDGRTGCIGCPLVSDGIEDTLTRLCKFDGFEYLEPLQQLRPMHREIRQFKHRLRKDGSETKADGSLVKNPGRYGPLTLDARLQFLERILQIQSQVNVRARAENSPPVWLINPKEEARIRELIAAKTYPNKWTGDELVGDRMMPEYYSDGSIQPLLFDLANVD